MSLDDALESAIGDVPDCVAGAVLDMTTGLVLAVSAQDPEDEEAIESAAAALPDLFEGGAFGGVAEAFGRESDAAAGFSEFIVLGKKHVHLFLRNPSDPDQVMSLVCRREAKIGMVLAKSRKTVEAVAAAV